MSDPERFTVLDVTFQAAPTKNGFPYLWRPVIEGLAFAVFRHDTGSDRPYAVTRVRFGSLLAAGRAAVTYKTAAVERARQEVKQYDDARARLVESIAREAQR